MVLHSIVCNLWFFLYINIYYLCVEPALPSLKCTILTTLTFCFNQVLCNSVIESLLIKFSSTNNHVQIATLNQKQQKNWHFLAVFNKHVLLENVSSSKSILISLQEWAWFSVNFCKITRILSLLIKHYS